MLFFNRTPIFALILAASGLIAPNVFAQNFILIQDSEKKINVTDADIMVDAQRLPVESRKIAMSKPQNIQAVATNLYTRRLLALEAEKSGLANDPQIQAALRIAHDRVLSDARLAQIDAAAEPKDDKALDKYAKQIYDTNPSRFQTPERLQVRHILIKREGDGTDAKAQAERLLEQLKKGGDFAAKAKELSQDPGSASKGGELPLFGHGQMVPPFETAAFALKNPGEFAPVVETQFGYHIIQLQERKPAGVQPFNEVKTALRAEVRGKLSSEARSAESARLLQDAEIDDEAIEAFAAKFR